MQLGIAYGWLDVCCMLVPHPVTSSSSSIFSCSKFNCQKPESLNWKQRLLQMLLRRTHVAIASVCCVTTCRCSYRYIHLQLRTTAVMAGLECRCLCASYLSMYIW
jgi:hypothetical protein